jgi:hypothetical protein
MRGSQDERGRIQKKRQAERGRKEEKNEGKGSLLKT